MNFTGKPFRWLFEIEKTSGAFIRFLEGFWALVFLLVGSFFDHSTIAYVFAGLGVAGVVVMMIEPTLHLLLSFWCLLFRVTISRDEDKLRLVIGRYRGSLDIEKINSVIIKTENNMDSVIVNIQKGTEETAGHFRLIPGTVGDTSKVIELRDFFEKCGITIEQDEFVTTKEPYRFNKFIFAGCIIMDILAVTILAHSFL